MKGKAHEDADGNPPGGSDQVTVDCVLERKRGAQKDRKDPDASKPASEKVGLELPAAEGL